jgi:hypothetical protein
MASLSGQRQKQQQILTFFYLQELAKQMKEIFLKVQKNEHGQEQTRDESDIAVQSTGSEDTSTSQDEVRTI